MLSKLLQLPAIVRAIFFYFLIGGLKMEPDKILIDIRTCELTLKEVMDQIRVWQAEMPDYEIFMDGDAYAIVARKKH